MLPAQRGNVCVLGEVPRSVRFPKQSLEDGKVSGCFRKQHNGRRLKQSPQIVQDHLKGDGEVKDARMCDNADELIDAGPRNRPGEGAFREFLESLSCLLVMRARENFRVDQEICVYSQHDLASIHEVEEFVAIQQIHPRLLARLPASQLQLEAPLGPAGKGVPEEAVDDRPQGGALLGGSPLEESKQGVFYHQCGSSHV